MLSFYGNDMIFLFIFSILLFWLVLSFLWYIKTYQYYKCLKSLPGPTPIPILGNALEIRSFTGILPRLMELKGKYGSLYKMVNGFRGTAIVISDYKFLETLLTSTAILDKSDNYTFVEKWLGTGLLMSTGVKWKKRRKMITPAFHFKILEQFVDIFEKNARIFVEKLKEEQLTSTCFDVYPYATLAALDNICETALGTEINAQRDTHSKYVRSVKEMCRILMKRTMNPLFHYDFLYGHSGLYKEEQEALKVLHDATLSVIRQKKEELLSKEQFDEEDSGMGIKKKMAFLDLLLQSTIDGKPLSDNDLREEVDTFMFEGHDTTASAISFLLFNLSKHTEVQKKVVEELNRIFSDNNRRPCTYNDLQEMKYLEAVIKETLRLYPPVPFVGRKTCHSFNYDGLTVPPETQLLIFLYGIMRDPKFWKEPDKFDPDRFLTESDVINRQPYVYIPFSAGPRNCIGQKFAMLEVKSTVSNVLRNLEVLPAEPIQELVLSAEVTLKSANGINIRIRERNSL